VQECPPPRKGAGERIWFAPRRASPHLQKERGDQFRYARAQSFGRRLTRNGPSPTAAAEIALACHPRDENTDRHVGHGAIIRLDAYVAELVLRVVGLPFSKEDAIPPLKAEMSSGYLGARHRLAVIVAAALFGIPRMRVRDADD
jgi:hypothetical protein